MSTLPADRQADLSNLPDPVTFVVAVEAVDTNLTRAFIGKFFDALQDGSIAARATPTPPKTSDAVLDSAKNPTPAWWESYDRRRDEQGRPLPAPQDWSNWLLSGGIEVSATDVMRFIDDSIRAELARARLHSKIALFESVWSDLEVWAWIAARDGDLVTSMRNWGLAIDDDKSALRSTAFKYLRFQVSRHFCVCDTPSPYPGVSKPNTCTCLSAAWNRMVEALQSGKITATYAGIDGIQRSAETSAFRGARLDSRHSRFSLTGTDIELLFDQKEVCTLGVAVVPHTLEQRSAWMAGHPGLGSGPIKLLAPDMFG